MDYYDNKNTQHWQKIDKYFLEEYLKQINPNFIPITDYTPISFSDSIQNYIPLLLERTNVLIVGSQCNDLLNNKYPKIINVFSMQKEKKFPKRNTFNFMIQDKHENEMVVLCNEIECNFEHNIHPHLEIELFVSFVMCVLPPTQKKIIQIIDYEKIRLWDRSSVMTLQEAIIQNIMKKMIMDSINMNKVIKKKIKLRRMCSGKKICLYNYFIRYFSCLWLC